AFQAIERRFARQARVAIVIVGLTGLYMIVQADMWDRFRSAEYWWMHAMVCIWAIFAIGLFLVEPSHEVERRVPRMPDRGGETGYNRLRRAGANREVVVTSPSATDDRRRIRHI